LCTIVLLIRPSHAWPLLLAANRDERLDRPWDPPSAHWPDRPGVIAGRDRSAGGTWMGVNQHGVAAAVLNRVGSLGPAPDKWSRGELPLIALEHASAANGAAAIGALNAARYRTFNLVVADAHGAWFLRGLGEGPVGASPLAAGLHMITAHDPNDVTSPRIARHLPRFEAVPPPTPPDHWQSWQVLLADASGPAGTELNIPPRAGFGTLCASLLALPAAGRPSWRFAAGPPDRAPFQPVENI
jgi:hypothetical protein